MTESKLKKYEIKNRKMSGLNLKFNYGDEEDALRRQDSADFFTDQRTSSRNGPSQINLVKRPNMDIQQMETKVLQQKRD